MIGPRILGLTASPVSGASPEQVAQALDALSREMHGAVPFHPANLESDEEAGTTVREVYVGQATDAQLDFREAARCDLFAVERAVNSALMPSDWLTFGNERDLGDPATLGRLRGCVASVRRKYAGELGRALREQVPMVGGHLPVFAIADDGKDAEFEDALARGFPQERAGGSGGAVEMNLGDGLQCLTRLQWLGKGSVARVRSKMGTCGGFQQSS